MGTNPKVPKILAVETRIQNGNAGIQIPSPKHHISKANKELRCTYKKITKKVA